MKKWMRLGLSALCAAALMTSMVLAVEEPPAVTTEIQPMEAEMGSTLDLSISLFSNAGWPEDARCYGDLLNGVAYDYYQAIETALQNTANFTIETESVDANGTLMEIPFVVVPMIDKYRVTTQEQYDAWWQEAKANMDVAIEAYMQDHPGDFWRGFWFSTIPDLIQDAEGYTAGIGAQFEIAAECVDEEERARIQFAIEKQAEALLEATETMSDVAKLAYWDNWLAETNDYNSAAAAGSFAYGSRYPWNITAGLLDEEEPVCEGYAEAMQYLCHLASIDCLTVTGCGHMWNVVLLDGIWYELDPTHNDPIYQDFQTGEILGTMEFSIRTYFLSEKRTDGYVVEQILAVPDISDVGYFDSWRVENGTIRGGETYSNSAPMMWFALYNEKGKMIALESADNFAWSSTTNMYTAPAFDAGKMKDAVRIELFRLDSGLTPYSGETSTNILTKTNTTIQ